MAREWRGRFNASRKRSFLSTMDRSTWPCRGSKTKKWIRAKWGVSENNRKARFYSLTAKGREQLAEKTSEWERLTQGNGIDFGRERRTERRGGIGMFRRKRSKDDFAEEIKAHLELEADELKHEGVSEDEARRKARVEFGNVRAAQERFYLRNRMVWFDNLLGDIKFAIRQLLRESRIRHHRDSLCWLSASAPAWPSLVLWMRLCWSRCPMQMSIGSCR